MLFTPSRGQSSRARLWLGLWLLGLTLLPPTTTQATDADARRILGAMRRLIRRAPPTAAREAREAVRQFEARA